MGAQVGGGSYLVASRRQECGKLGTAIIRRRNGQSRVG